MSLGRGLVRADVAAILFDEPLTVIDPSLKWQLRSKLKAVHRALDLLMMYVTHDQVEALTFADEVVVMKDGRVVQVATPAQLFEQPEHTFVGYFIGSPGMNLVAANVADHVAHVAGHDIELGGALSQARGPAPRRSRVSSRLCLAGARRRHSGADPARRGSRATPAGAGGAGPARNFRNGAGWAVDRRRAKPDCRSGRIGYLFTSTTSSSWEIVDDGKAVQ